MIKTLALAGATAALVIGSIAVAQTSSKSDMSRSSNPPAATDTSGYGSSAATPGATSSSATTASQYGNNASAATSDTDKTSKSGERG